MFAEFLYLCGMEKKILIIPDVHGRRFWRDAIESDDYDKVIFLGDYVDPYPNEGIGSFTAQEGLERIILYHDEHPDKVVLPTHNNSMAIRTLRLTLPVSTVATLSCSTRRASEKYKSCGH